VQHDELILAGSMVTDSEISNFSEARGDWMATMSKTGTMHKDAESSFHGLMDPSGVSFL